jgi:hypothetical protein
MDDAVAHADQPVVAEPLSQKAPQMLDRGVVAERRALPPCPLAHDTARRILGHEPGRRVETLDLAAHVEVERALAHHE